MNFPQILPLKIQLFLSFTIFQLLYKLLLSIYITDITIHFLIKYTALSFFLYTIRLLHTTPVTIPCSSIIEKKI